jgi:acetyl-CoA synthetase
MEADSQPIARQKSMAAEAIFILPTPLTGMPKGVVHSTGGLHRLCAMTHQHTFDYHDGDILQYR